MPLPLAAFAGYRGPRAWYDDDQVDQFGIPQQQAPAAPGAPTPPVGEVPPEVAAFLPKGFPSGPGGHTMTVMNGPNLAFARFGQDGMLSNHYAVDNAFSANPQGGGFSFENGPDGNRTMLTEKDRYQRGVIDQEMELKKMAIQAQLAGAGLKAGAGGAVAHDVGIAMNATNKALPVGDRRRASQDEIAAEKTLQEADMANARTARIPGLNTKSPADGGLLLAPNQDTEAQRQARGVRAAGRVMRAASDADKPGQINPFSFARAMYAEPGAVENGIANPHFLQALQTALANPENASFGGPQEFQKNIKALIFNALGRLGSEHPVNDFQRGTLGKGVLGVGGMNAEGLYDRSTNTYYGIPRNYQEGWLKRNLMGGNVDPTELNRTVDFLGQVMRYTPPVK